jgi:hypothetical protein
VALVSNASPWALPLLGVHAAGRRSAWDVRVFRGAVRAQGRVRDPWCGILDSESRIRDPIVKC